MPIPLFMYTVRGKFMAINGIKSTDFFRGIEKLRFATSSIKPEQKDLAEGYAPITVSLWGEHNHTHSCNHHGHMTIGGVTPSFGAGRPTNNPADLDPIEADTQSGFRLSSLDMPMICPDCGRPIMTKPIFTAIKQELAAADESSYIDVIENHSEFLLPQEEKIFEFIKAEKAKHPEKTISQIVREERQNRLGQLEQEQYAVLDEMGAYADTLSDDDRAEIDELLQKAADIIYARNENFAFKRTKFLELVNSLELDKPEIKEKLLEIAEKLPSSSAVFNKPSSFTV